MKSWIMVAVAATAIASCSSRPPSAGPSVDRRFFFNGRVVRGDGTPPIQNAAFLVVDGLITRLGAGGSVEAPAGATTIDLGGRTVMPLLHSLHVHVGYLDGRSFSAEHYSSEAGAREAVQRLDESDVDLVKIGVCESWRTCSRWTMPRGS